MKLYLDTETWLCVVCAALAIGMFIGIMMC